MSPSDLSKIFEGIRKAERDRYKFIRFHLRNVHFYTRPLVPTVRR
jgi:hypothetical protein